MTTRVDPHRSERRSRAVHLALAVIAWTGQRVLGWVARARRSQAIWKLQAMDDRMLADIGLQRGGIEAACRFGRHPAHTGTTSDSHGRRAAA
jgi:uncharacterized protein YjiS (DUF1127 family)